MTENNVTINGYELISLNHVIHSGYTARIKKDAIVFIGEGYLPMIALKNALLKIENYDINNADDLV